MSKQLEHVGNQTN